MDGQVEKQSVVKGQRVYKDIWTLSTGEQLFLQTEDNEHNKYAVAVLKVPRAIFWLHHPRTQILGRSTQNSLAAAFLSVTLA